MTNIQVLGSFTVAVLALATAFQIGLAAGAPWGAMAYGGRAISGGGPLPWPYRLASAFTALVLLGAVWVVLASVDVVARGPVSTGKLTVILWSMTAFLALNTLGNTRSRHPVERWGAGTVTAILAILCALLAVSTG